MNEHGISLYDANDVLPVGFTGTPWEIIFNGLRDVLKNNFSDAPGSFIFAACALHYIAKGDYDKATDPAVLDGLASALQVPFWVENSAQTERAAAILHLWLTWTPTKANLKALALASGMQGFNSHEQYTLTEWGYYARSFLFDFGDGALDSFFATGDTDEEKYASICVALYRFIGRLNGAPARVLVGEGFVLNYTAPEAEPEGAKYYTRADQKDLVLRMGYNFDLYNADGSYLYTPDHFAVFSLQGVRDTMGHNTEISGNTHMVFTDNGQARLYWGQSPATAYAVYISIDIHIPGKTRAWLNVDHTDMNLPPNAVPGLPLLDGDGEPLSGEGYSLFAAYGSACVSIGIGDLYLVGDGPIYLRASVYISGINQVWLTYTPPPPPPPVEFIPYIVVDSTTGEVLLSQPEDPMEYAAIQTVLLEDENDYITVYETGVPTESFYFTANGRNETENTNISHSTIPVYFGDGTAPEADTPYDGSSVLAFMDVTGNTKQADGESLYVDDGVLKLDAPDTDEGEQWAAPVEHIEPSSSLPTVSTSGDFNNNNWLYANTQGADVTVASGNSTLVGLSGGSTPAAVNYDATKAYAIIMWGTYQSASGSGHAEFSIVDSSGKIYAQNNSSGSLKLYALRCAVCSDSTSIVITVYSSTDGTAYNSFKYTTSGTDYYYVLDETQTDWTDDLASIGYSLEPPAPSELTAYFTNQGSAATSDSNPSYGSYTLYDASGQRISTQSE